MNRLKEIRKLRNLTQKDLAKLTKISRVQISRYENGQDIPSSNLKTFSKILNISSDYLIGIKNSDINIKNIYNKDEIKKIKNTLEKTAQYLNQLLNQSKKEKD
jgi:transcriptional regulator with XRE-family HTH domain